MLLTPRYRVMPQLAQTSAPRPSRAKLVHTVIGTLLLAGIALSWWAKPPHVNPLVDSQAADAMALVQTHRAKGSPTIRQALDERARRIADRGQRVRLGEWNVEREMENVYVVRVVLREQEGSRWVERE